MRQPALFISHGSPAFLLRENDTTHFWKTLPQLLPAKPRAVLCVSAHWDATQLHISGTSGKTGIMHDFYGFPDALYDMQWPDHDDPGTSAWLLRCLNELGVAVIQQNRPKDHGVWVPLMQAWPKPGFPVYQLSLTLAQGLETHWRLGQQLQALRDEGVLIIGSGAITHNLGALDWQAPVGVYVPWASSFVEAMEQGMFSGEHALLCQPWQMPFGRQCHPTLEHYAPLLLVMGAAGGRPLRAMHRSWMYATFALHAYAEGMV